MSFIPAHHMVSVDAARPRYTAMLLHGILGSGQNLRSFARRLVQAAPAWQILLVDLRNHGDSGHPAGPHTMNRCAGDLTALNRNLGLRPQLLVGHSFGGKVALAYARNEPHRLRRVWVLDATPGVLPAHAREKHIVSQILHAVKATPTPLSRRDELIDCFEAHGLSRPIAQWMMTNLREKGNGLEWRFEPDAAEEMILDYWDTDLWPFVLAPPKGLSIDFIQAENSNRWDEESLRRFAAMKEQEQVRLHPLPNAGHWVHLDNPSGLIDLMLESFQDAQE